MTFIFMLRLYNEISIVLRKALNKIIITLGVAITPILHFSRFLPKFCKFCAIIFSDWSIVWNIWMIICARRRLKNKCQKPRPSYCHRDIVARFLRPTENWKLSGMLTLFCYNHHQCRIVIIFPIITNALQWWMITHQLHNL